MPNSAGEKEEEEKASMGRTKRHKWVFSRAEDEKVCDVCQCGGNGPSLFFSDLFSFTIGLLFFLFPVELPQRGNYSSLISQK